MVRASYSRPPRASPRSSREHAASRRGVSIHSARTACGRHRSMRLASSLLQRSRSGSFRAPLQQQVWLCSARRTFSSSQIPIHEQIEAVAASAGPELAQSCAGTAGRRARPRRSALYMPGSRRRALEKARTLDADCIIMDRAHAIIVILLTVAYIDHCQCALVFVTGAA